MQRNMMCFCIILRIFVVFIVSQKAHTANYK